MRNDVKVLTLQGGGDIIAYVNGDKIIKPYGIFPTQNGGFGITPFIPYVKETELSRDQLPTQGVELTPVDKLADAYIQATSEITVPSNKNLVLPNA